MGARDIIEATRDYERGERLRASTVNAVLAALRAQPDGEEGAWDRGSFSIRASKGWNPWPVPFLNQASEDLPPFGVAEVMTPGATSNTPGCYVNKPGNTAGAGGVAQLQRRYLVNGPRVCKPNSVGWGSYLERAGLVAFDYGGDGLPTMAQEWGIKKDSWILGKDRYGFFPSGGGYINYAGTNVMLAYQVPLQQVLVKGPTGLSQGSPWSANTKKDVRVFTKEFAADTQLVVRDCMNYTANVIDSDANLALSWFAGGPVAAALRC